MSRDYNMGIRTEPNYGVLDTWEYMGVIWRAFYFSTLPVLIQNITVYCSNCRPSSDTDYSLNSSPGGDDMLN